MRPAALDGGLVDLVGVGSLQEGGRRQLPRRALHRRAELDLELGGLDRLVELGRERLGLARAGLAARRGGLGVVEVDEVVGVLVEDVERRGASLVGPLEPREKRWVPTRRSVSAMAAPAGRVAAAVVSAATRTGTRVSTTRPPMPIAARISPAPHGASPEASGPAAATPSSPPAATRSSVGASRPGPAARQVEQAAAGDGDHQPADPEVGARRGVEVDLVARRSRDRPARGSRRWRSGPPARAGGPTRRSVPMAVSRPRPTGPATSAYTPIPATIPTRDAQQPEQVARVPPEGGGQAADQPVDERGRRGRGVPPLGRRALGPPAAGTLGRSHSAHNRTSSPTSHRRFTGRRCPRSPRQPVARSGSVYRGC